MTNIWKRSLSIFLALFMVIGMMPMNVFAAEGEDAKVVTTAQELQYALEAGGEVKLGGNITLSTSLSLQDATLDLAGYNLNTDSYTLGAAQGGTLTIRDSSEGKGKITVTTTNGSAATGGIMNGGTLNIEGGTFESNKGGYAIRHGNDNNEDTKTVITGGTFNGGFKMDWGIVEISNAVVTSDKFEIGPKASLTISGGTFSKDVTQYVAEGYQCGKNGNGTWTVVEAPKTYVAQIGETKYTSIYEAVNAAQDGDTITVIADHEVDCSQVTNMNEEQNTSVLWYIDNDITLDLNGKTVTVTNTITTNGTTLAGIVYAADGADVVVTGNGAIWQNDSDGWADLFFAANGSTLTVKNGTYTCDPDEGVLSNYMLYAAGGLLTIEGGTYTHTTPGYQYIFNVMNGTHDIVITGGTFTKDPATESEVTIPEGYTSVDNGNGTWTVVEAPKNYVAQIGETKYETLTEAIAAVKNGETITFLTDINESVTIKQVKNVNFTIDGAGKTYTGTMTVNGTGYASDQSQGLTIQNVNFVVEGYGIYAYAKNNYARNVTVDGCSFTGTDGDNLDYGIALRHVYNITVKNTTGTNLFDLVYGGGSLTGFEAENVTVTNSKNGIWLSYVNSTATFKNLTMTGMLGSGIGIKNGATGTVTIEDCNINAAEGAVTFEPLDDTTNTKKVTLVFKGRNTLTNNEGNWLLANLLDQLYGSKVIVNLTEATYLNVNNISYGGLPYRAVLVDANVPHIYTFEKFVPAITLDDVKNQVSIKGACDHLDGTKYTNDTYLEEEYTTLGEVTWNDTAYTCTVTFALRDFLESCIDQQTCTYDHTLPADSPETITYVATYDSAESKWTITDGPWTIEFAGIKNVTYNFYCTDPTPAITLDDVKNQVSIKGACDHRDGSTTSENLGLETYGTLGEVTWNGTSYTCEITFNLKEALEECIDKVENCTNDHSVPADSPETITYVATYDSAESKWTITDGPCTIEFAGIKNVTYKFDCTDPTPAITLDDVYNLVFVQGACKHLDGTEYVEGTYLEEKYISLGDVTWNGTAYTCPVTFALQEYLEECIAEQTCTCIHSVPAKYHGTVEYVVTYNSNANKWTYTEYVGGVRTFTYNFDCIKAVAEVVETGVQYGSLQEALNACTNGETVKLLVDITYTDEDVVSAHGGGTGFGKHDAYNPSIIYTGGTKGDTDAQNQPSNVNAVLDLNGHTITNNADAYLFLIMDNAKLTFKDSVGTGSVTSTTETPVIWAVGTETLVTIESGKYTTASATGLLWSTHGADMVITGGEFSTTADDASLLIVRNEQDRNNPNYFVDGKATVTITGGTFDYNPEKTCDDYTGTEFNACAEGYYAIDNGNGTWTVSDDYVEWIKAELLAGRSVTLAKDIVVDGHYIDSIPAATNGNGKYPNYGIFNVYGDTVTFDLNGHTITYNGHENFEWNGKTYNSCTVAHGLFMANDGGKLTIVDGVGTGKVDVHGVASGVYSCSPDSVITVTGGTWTNDGCATCDGTNLFLYASHGGELYITGGTFEQEADPSSLIVEHGGEYKNSVIDYSKTKIEVSGGHFVGMNPEEAVQGIQSADNKLSWSTTNVVAEGYYALKCAEHENCWIIGEAVAVNVQTGKNYGDVTDALDEAKSGQTVKMLKDYTESMVMVTEGITLDLNGQTLTATYVAVFAAGHIVDDSESNAGRLDVDSKKFMIQESNKQLPVKTEDGYMFVEVIKFNELWKGVGYYVAQPFIETTALDALKEDYEATGVSIVFRVSWINNNGDKRVQDFVFGKEQTIPFFNSYEAKEAGKYGKQFSLQLTNLESDTGFTYETVVMSNTGVEFSSTGITK